MWYAFDEVERLYMNLVAIVLLFACIGLGIGYHFGYSSGRIDGYGSAKRHIEYVTAVSKKYQDRCQDMLKIVDQWEALEKENNEADTPSDRQDPDDFPTR